MKAISKQIPENCPLKVASKRMRRINGKELQFYYLKWPFASDIVRGHVWSFQI